MLKSHLNYIRNKYFFVCYPCKVGLSGIEDLGQILR